MRLSPVPVPRDLSLKRNLGLLIARLAGWKKVVFMDDDIYGIEPGGLLRASAALDSNPISCFLVEAGDAVHDRLPTEDNSAVCHALRLAGRKQNVYASGSALGVNCFEDLSFFPNIYNEDWFFMLRETERAAIARVGFVKQREYNPYIAARARYEEFGDVLAEGLLAHLHLGISKQPDVRYWQQFLEARRVLLREIRAGLQKSESQYAASATNAIKASQRQLRLVTPDACVEYLKNFESDRRAWGRRLDALPPPTHDLERALSDLHLR
jgi:glycosyltransferase involved in cell wall biosynthesis